MSIIDQAFTVKYGNFPVANLSTHTPQKSTEGLLSEPIKNATSISGTIARRTLTTLAMPFLVVANIIEGVVRFLIGVLALMISPIEMLYAKRSFSETYAIRLMASTLTAFQGVVFIILATVGNFFHSSPSMFASEAMKKVHLA